MEEQRLLQVGLAQVCVWVTGSCKSSRVGGKTCYVLASVQRRPQLRTVQSVIQGRETAAQGADGLGAGNGWLEHAAGMRKRKRQLNSINAGEIDSPRNFTQVLPTASRSRTKVGL